MADAFPIPARVDTSEPTSGKRGAPDLDFDFLSGVQQNMRSNVADAANSVGPQFADLSTMLSQFNSTIKEVRKEKRDKDLLTRTRINEYATESDRIRQKAMEAAADPFNELKALFTDTPSQREWVARQNAVANDMNRLRREYAGNQAEFNYKLQDAAQGIQIARQKLGLTKEFLQTNAAAAQAMTTQINAQSVLMQHQLSAMQLPDLQKELADPNGKINKGLVEDAILGKQTLLAKLSAARSDSTKSTLERKAAEFKLLMEYPQYIDRGAVDQSYITGKIVTEPFTGIQITPQMASELKPRLDEAEQKSAQLSADLFENDLMAQRSYANFVSVAGRFLPPGVSIVGRDADGKVVTGNFDVLPPEMQQLATSMVEANEQVKTIDWVLSTQADLNPEMARDQIIFKRVLNAKITEANKKFTDLAVEQATTGMKDKEAIAATKQFIENGRIENNDGAKTLMTAESLSQLAGQDTGGQHGAGWDKMYQEFSALYRGNWEEYLGGNADILNEDGEVDQGKLLARFLSGDVAAREASNLASSKALNAVNMDSGRPQNRVMSAALNDWYEIGLNYAIQDLMERHAAEPETTKALGKLIMGDVALSPNVTRIKDENGKELDAVNVLLARIAMAESEMKEAGALNPDSDLVSELKSILLSNAFYQNPVVQELVTPRTAGAAAMNRMVFRNQAASYFRNGLKQIIQSVPTDDLPTAMEYSRLLIRSTARMTEGRGEELEQRRQDAFRLKELREQGADKAHNLGPTLKQIMLQDAE